MSCEGGPRIITSVTQAIFRTLWLKQSLTEAISAPRVHHQLLPPFLDVENTMDPVRQSSASTSSIPLPEMTYAIDTVQYIIYCSCRFASGNGGLTAGARTRGARRGNRAVGGERHHAERVRRLGGCERLSQRRRARRLLISESLIRVRQTGHSARSWRQFVATRLVASRLVARFLLRSAFRALCSASAHFLLRVLFFLSLIFLSFSPSCSYFSYYYCSSSSF